MKEIPLFCVEMFTKKYGVHPSFVEVMLPYSESAIKTVIKKSYLLWYRDFVNEKGEVSHFFASGVKPNSPEFKKAVGI